MEKPTVDELKKQHQQAIDLFTLLTARKANKLTITMQAKIVINILEDWLTAINGDESWKPNQPKPDES